MAISKTFSVGDVVLNFSTTAFVVAVDAERGILLADVTRPRAGKWHADPAKCVMVAESGTPVAKAVLAASKSAVRRDVLRELANAGRK